MTTGTNTLSTTGINAIPILSTLIKVITVFACGFWKSLICLERDKGNKTMSENRSPFPTHVGKLNGVTIYFKDIHMPNGVADVRRITPEELAQCWQERVAHLERHYKASLETAQRCAGKVQRCARETKQAEKALQAANRAAELLKQKLNEAELEMP
jgi:hypothetical protein